MQSCCGVAALTTRVDSHSRRMQCKTSLRCPMHPGRPPTAPPALFPPFIFGQGSGEMAALEMAYSQHQPAPRWDSTQSGDMLTAPAFVRRQCLNKQRKGEAGLAASRQSLSTAVRLHRGCDKYIHHVTAAVVGLVAGCCLEHHAWQRASIRQLPEQKNCH